MIQTQKLEKSIFSSLKTGRVFKENVKNSNSKNKRKKKSTPFPFQMMENIWQLQATMK
jgi:hypothetical protein